MKKFNVVLVLLVVLLLAASPAMAGTWYVGGGINSVSLGGDLDGVDSDGGIALNFGYNFNPGFALDFIMGSSSHDDWDGDSLEYGRFDMGAVFIFGSDFMPYLTVGLSGHGLNYDDIDLTWEGGGLFLGGGFDYYFTPGHSIDVGLRLHSWNVDARSGSVIIADVGDATTSVLTIMYNYHFLM